jgi:Zn-dependent protease
VRIGGIRFLGRELLDFAAAWVALSLAFAMFLNPGIMRALFRSHPVDASLIVNAVAVSALTVGVGFLLHELGHKLVAVHYGQVAVFRADYGMLAVAILAALAGWLFAAPGAVHHRGRLTDRQAGLIALAGPAVNVGLVGLFFGLATLPFATVAGLAGLGVTVNLLLAAFNMLPVGPLDGRTVLAWSPTVYLLSAAVTIGPAVFVLLEFVL